MGDDLEDYQRDRRGLFGENAEAYDLGRPGYPAQVFDLLREFGGVGPGSRVLEIGAGSGQATGPLLETGATVLAVELSPELAERLSSKYDETQRLEVRVGAFEDQHFEAGSIDLAVSATAFHWIPTEPGLHKCADALNGGGSLALWWNVYGDPERSDPFHQALQPVLARLEPSLLDAPSTGTPAPAALQYALDTDARIGEIAATGRFGPVHHELVPWTGRHRPEEIRSIFATFSHWLALPDERRRVVLDALEQLAHDEFGGVVERPYLTSAYLAHKAVA